MRLLTQRLLVILVKKGIASKLIDYVIKNLGVKIILAKTDKDAVGFYKKYEFKTVTIKNKEYTRYKCILKIAGNKFENFETSRLKPENFEKSNN